VIWLLPCDVWQVSGDRFRLRFGLTRLRARKLMRPRNAANARAMMRPPHSLRSALRHESAAISPSPRFAAARSGMRNERVGIAPAFVK